MGLRVTLGTSQGVWSPYVLHTKWRDSGPCLMTLMLPQQTPTTSALAGFLQSNWQPIKAHSSGFLVQHERPGKTSNGS